MIVVITVNTVSKREIIFSLWQCVPLHIDLSSTMSNIIVTTFIEKEQFLFQNKHKHVCVCVCVCVCECVCVCACAHEYLNCVH